MTVIMRFENCPKEVQEWIEHWRAAPERYNGDYSDEYLKEAMSHLPMPLGTMLHLRRSVSIRDFGGDALASVSYMGVFLGDLSVVMISKFTGEIVLVDEDSSAYSKP